MRTIENSNRTNDNSTRRKRIFISFVLVVLLAMIGTATAVFAQTTTESTTSNPSTVVRTGNDGKVADDAYNASTILQKGYKKTADYARVSNKTDATQKNYQASEGATDSRYLYKWTEWSDKKQTTNADGTVTQTTGAQPTANIHVTSKIALDSDDSEDSDSEDGEDDGSGSSSGGSGSSGTSAGSSSAAASTQSTETTAVYCFTICTAHGFTIDICKSNLYTLKQNYDHVDIVAINTVYSDGIKITNDIPGTKSEFVDAAKKKANGDSTDYDRVMEKYITPLFSNGAIVLGSGPHHGAGVYTGLYRYLTNTNLDGKGSDVANAPLKDNLPSSIFVSFDNLNKATTGGFSIIDDKHDIWDTLKSYQERGRYFCMTSTYDKASGGISTTNGEGVVTVYNSGNQTTNIQRYTSYSLIDP